jgi:hypothetical protein
MKSSTRSARRRGMGRPALHNKPTLIRLPASTIARIEKLAGPRKMAAFIREAVEERLSRLEAATKKRKPK